MNKDFTKEEVKELDWLLYRQANNTYPMMQKDQDRMEFLIVKKYINCCINPHCQGYAGKEEDTHCPYCEQELYKM